MALIEVRRLVGDRAEKLRLASELESARTVQQLLFPKPTSGHIDAVYCPANEVGGDFWQALPAAGGGEIVVVGDVSGKGLRAAMMVSLLTGALRNRKSDRPAEILAELNRVTVSTMHTGFVTAMVAHVKDGRATIANAGHPAPYLNGEEVTLDAALPLGVDPDAVYTEREIACGEQLTLISDGVIEAENASRELFGFERTREISGDSAQQIVDAARAWGQKDDITVVTVKRVAA
jgi:serine phosphatase RsbU (regulator of sigma subunit)